MEYDCYVVPMAQYARNAHVRLETCVIDNAPVVAVSGHRAVTVFFPTILPGTPPSRPEATWVAYSCAGFYSH